ncbi:myosin-IIIb-like [Leptodactylus fuscus]|uniref:myosin-IIIb-like n=1 Tax=Leptodactylus fuscus TaxID=238119 RepID=UPI003F4F0CBE
MIKHNKFSPYESASKGILDIFGFENFSVNRFEQLCINLANEQLQNFFNHHIFLMEQQHYREEGVTDAAVAFTNNQPILDLFLARPGGVFSILDEQTSFPQASDASFVEKLSAGCHTNPYYERMRGKDLGFTIHHYAGKVQYTAVGFLEKNRDTIPMNIQNLFINSETSLLSLLFSASISRTGTLMPSQKEKVQITQDKASARKMSVGAQFRRSLGVLMEKLYAASPHFIRCIKPNREKQPGVFQCTEVLNQLRYNGLMETLRIRRDGFSWRPSFQDFIGQFGILLLTPDVPVTRDSCIQILQRAQLSGWQCGTSRLFFKYWHQDEMTQNLLRLRDAAVAIQKRYKGLLCRRTFQNLLDEMQKLKEKQKELEAEKERTRRQEEAAQRVASRPVPLPRRKTPPIKLSLSDTPSEPPLSPFDNPTFRPRLPSEVNEISEKKRMQRQKTLRWFKETEAEKVLDRGEIPPWLHGMISRRDTENLLMGKEPGDFLIRISQNRAGYILSYRAVDRCRHYMIDVRSNGCYVILGEDRAHTSLLALVEFHQITGIQPYGEILREPCGKMETRDLDCEELKFLRRTLSLGVENVQSPDPPTLVVSRSEESSQHYRKSIRRAMQEIQLASADGCKVEERRESVT